MTNDLTMEQGLFENGAKAVVEYGLLASFFVAMMLLFIWIIRKVVTVLLPAVVNWINKQVELMDTIQTTVTRIDSSVKSSEDVAKNISSTLQEHTSMLKQDTDDLKAVKAATERIETKVNGIHCQV